MNHDDVNAFRAAAPAPLRAPARRSRPWRWALFGVLLIACLASAGLALLLQSLGWWEQLGSGGISVTVDGQTWRVGTLGGSAGVLALAGLALALLLLLCAVPLVVALGLGGAAVGIGVAVLAVLVATAAALSPLLLVAAGVWLIARPRRRPPA